MPIISYFQNLFSRKKPLIVLCGPTATGKTALGIQLAKERNGEVVSADSRQVYRGLDVGTAKVTSDEACGVPHHMIDVVDPNYIYSVAEFQRDAHNVIADIHARGKLPILVGGTGMYIQAVVDNPVYPQVPPNKQLRSKLDKLDTNKLFARIVELDPERAQELDKHNRRRIIRAIEIAEAAGKIPRVKKQQRYKTKIIYLDLPDDELRKKIHQRNIKRIDALIKEVKNLNVSKERLHDLGLEYRYTLQYLEGEIASKEELVAILDTKTWQFAKRQRTWFKKYL